MSRPGAPSDAPGPPSPPERPTATTSVPPAEPEGPSEPVASGSRAFAYALCGSVALAWGLNFAAIKVGLRVMDPYAWNALRYAIASVVMAGLASVAHRRAWARGQPAARARLAGRGLLTVIGLGVLGHGIYQTLFITGLANTASGNAGTIMGTVPLQVAVYETVIGRHRGADGRTSSAAVGRLFAGVLLSVIGVVLVAVGRGQGLSVARETLFGDLFIGAASIVWASFATAMSPWVRRYGSGRVTAITFASGTPIVIALGLPGLGDGIAALRVSGDAVLALAYTIVIANVWAQFAYAAGIARLGSSRAALATNLMPVVALLAGWAAFGEPLTALALAGAGLVVVGVATGLPPARPRSVPSEA